MATPLVSVIMGSRSDWGTMRHAVEMLETLEVPHEAKVVSAHRTPTQSVYLTFCPVTPNKQTPFMFLVIYLKYG